MTFCTVINCMDGRIQLPVIQYLQKRFEAGYVDSVTEAGPIRLLSDGTGAAGVESILKRLGISLNKHNSVGVAVVGHHDCAGNPVSEEQQKEHIKKSLAFLRQHTGPLPCIGLWVDENWTVNELSDSSSSAVG